MRKPMVLNKYNLTISKIKKLTIDERILIQQIFKTGVIKI